MKIAFYIFIFLSQVNLAFGQTTSKTETIEIVGEHPEVSATYPGGLPALYKYINEKVTKNLTFTNDEAYILSKVIAKFTIDQNGFADSVSIIKTSKIPRLDSILVSELKNMPKWNPAKKNGKPTRQQYSFPMTICVK